MAPDLKSGSFWSSSREDLFGKYFNGEAGGWVDKEKTQLRMARPRIKIGEISLGETLVNWKDDTPQSMTVMIYNKGDNGAIDRDEFETRLERVKAALDTLTGVKSKEYRASRREAVVKVNGWSWVWDKGAAVVEMNLGQVVRAVRRLNDFGIPVLGVHRVDGMLVAPADILSRTEEAFS